MYFHCFQDSYKRFSWGQLIANSARMIWRSKLFFRCGNRRFVGQNMIGVSLTIFTNIISNKQQCRYFLNHSKFSIYFYKNIFTKIPNCSTNGGFSKFNVFQMEDALSGSWWYNTPSFAKYISYVRIAVIFYKLNVPPAFGKRENE